MPVAIAARPSALAPVASSDSDDEVHSNILRADYAGSAACQRCHPAIFDEWRRSPMHRMTRHVDDTEVAAPFAGETFTFKRDRLTMESHAGARFMRLVNGDGSQHLYRIRKVIGGHHREDFTGVEVASVAAPVTTSAREQVMPATFQLVDHSWRYKGYSVMTPERPSLKAGAVWSQTCIFCHNTEPLLSTVLGTLAGVGGYQGEVVDPLLPPSLRMPIDIKDAPGLAVAVATELRAEGAIVADGEPLPSLLKDAVRATRVHFGEAQLIEVGIGCESCHGGAREHVEHSSRRPSLMLRSPLLASRASGAQPTHAEQVNRVCARCHQVLFSHYQPTWEGGRRSRDPGGSSINSGEARDFLLGHCQGQLDCVACHSPHAPDNGARMAALEGEAGNAICLGCHARYAGAALTAHTHHAASSTGSLCLSCHMPKKNMSLDHRLTRYHRIGSPNDPQRAEHDRPLECALCHTDRTVAQLADTMDGWWGKHLDRAALTALYGRLDVLPLPSTIERGQPHEQAVALGVLAERGTKDRRVAELAAEQLTHAIPIVRYYALAAFARALGKPAPIGLFSDDDAIARAATQLLQREGWSASQSKPSVKSASGDDDE